MGWWDPAYKDVGGRYFWFQPDDAEYAKMKKLLAKVIRKK